MRGRGAQVHRPRSISDISMKQQADLFKSGVPVFAVELVKERMIDGPVITGPAGVAEFAINYLRRADRENFCVLMLATNGRIIGVSTVHVGSLNASIVRPADVFKCAILANSAAIVVFHGHPSGNPEPSAEDIAVTRQLVEAGRVIGIPVRDHLIVTPGGEYTSLAERGAI